jgi:hypothetical protein
MATMIASLRRSCGHVLGQIEGWPQKPDPYALGAMRPATPRLRATRPSWVFLIGIPIALWMAIDGIVPSKAAGPAPASVSEIPQRFRGVWVFDRAHCTNSFPNRHVHIKADAIEEGPDVVTRLMAVSKATHISVIVGQPDDVALVLSGQGSDRDAGQGSRAMLTLSDADRALRWSSPGSATRNLFRC